MSSSPTDGNDINIDVEKGSVHDSELKKELDERFGGGTGGGNRRSVLPPLPVEGESDDESLAPPRPPFATESHYAQSPMTMDIHPAAFTPTNHQMFQELKALQTELSDFLVQHVAKTTNLQASLHPGDPLKLLRKRGSAFERDNGQCRPPILYVFLPHCWYIDVMWLEKGVYYPLARLESPRTRTKLPFRG
jgi:hypothetical protein